MREIGFWLLLTDVLSKSVNPAHLCLWHVVTLSLIFKTILHLLPTSITLLLFVTSESIRVFNVYQCYSLSHQNPSESSMDFMCTTYHSDVVIWFTSFFFSSGFSNLITLFSSCFCYRNVWQKPDFTVFVVCDVLCRNLAKTISTQTPEMEQKYLKIYEVNCAVICSYTSFQVFNPNVLFSVIFTVSFICII